MKLLTKEIVDKLKKYPLYSQENIPTMEKRVLVKFFNPYGVGTWLVTEAETQNEDILLFGLVDLGYGYEWGYFSYNELNSLRVNVWGCKMPIERDLYTSGKFVKDFVKEGDLM